MLATFSRHNDTIFAFQNAMDPYLFWGMCWSMLFLGMVGLVPLHPHKDLTSHGMIMLVLRRIFLGSIAIELILFLAFASTVDGSFGEEALNKLLKALAWKWGLLIPLFLIAGIASRMCYHRWIVPRISKFLRKMRITQTEDTVSDMKNEISKYKAIDYEPAKYHKADKMFLGLDDLTKEPVYVDLGTWDETHKMVVGTTRFGKGITFQIWAAQAIKRGKVLIHVDPKTDKYMPSVLKQEAGKHGKAFLSVDLVSDLHPGTYAPFVHGAPEDRRDRFNEIMGLREQGNNADFYKAVARRYLVNVFHEADEQGDKTTIPYLLDKVIEIKEADIGNRDEDSARRKSLESVVSRLMEMAAYKKICGDGGFSLERTLMNPEGAVVYFRGHLENPVLLSATRAFIIEMRQEIKRLNGLRTRDVEIQIDELKFLLSRTILGALATITGEGATLAMAFQSFGDIENPEDETINGKAALKAMLTNCQIKEIFGGSDADAAEWIAKTTGDTSKRSVRMEQTDVNAMGGETWSAKRTFGDVQEYVIPENVVKALPPKVGVLMRPTALARVITVAPVKV
ncbi:TraM recognition domain-containing protein [Acetobacter persici]|uniref:TraM recognition domain-containing protein n=1 Tax=Acetobacter persici TaxID=1076596 RepID=UPI00201112B4|nr:TraM recognition domain-containing protein [Acetobacter persici]